MAGSPWCSPCGPGPSDCSGRHPDHGRFVTDRCRDGYSTSPSACHVSMPSAEFASWPKRDADGPGCGTSSCYGKLTWRSNPSCLSHLMDNSGPVLHRPLVAAKARGATYEQAQQAQVTFTGQLTLVGAGILAAAAVTSVTVASAGEVSRGHDDAGNAKAGADHVVCVQGNEPDGNAIHVFKRAQDGRLSSVGSYATGGKSGDQVDAPTDSLAAQGSLVYDDRSGLLLAVNAGGAGGRAAHPGGGARTASQRERGTGTPPPQVRRESAWSGRDRGGAGAERVGDAVAHQGARRWRRGVGADLAFDRPLNRALGRRIEGPEMSTILDAPYLRVRGSPPGVPLRSPAPVYAAACSPSSRSSSDP